MFYRQNVKNTPYPALGLCDHQEKNLPSGKIIQLSVRRLFKSAECGYGSGLNSYSIILIIRAWIEAWQPHPEIGRLSASLAFRSVAGSRSKDFLGVRISISTRWLLQSFLLRNHLFSIVLTKMLSSYERYKEQWEPHWKTNKSGNSEQCTNYHCLLLQLFYHY